MNRVFALKDVAYAAKEGGGTISGAQELDVLVEGAFAVLNDKGVLVPSGLPAVTDPVLLDSKTVQIAHKRGGNIQIVNLVPRVGTRVDRTNYRASTKPVITVGGNSAALALPFTSEGNAEVSVRDISYSSSSNFGYKNVSVYKKSYMTDEEVVDALVAKLNSADSFVTAAKVGTTNLGITITPKEDDVAISVSVGGMFEGASIATTTAAVHSIGKGKDLLQMEKDASVEQGNSNFIDYTQEHYSQAFGTDINKNYDVIALAWEGLHASPSTVKPVMHNSLVLGVESDASTLDSDGALAILTPVFTELYSADSGAEGASDDGTDTDGVSGN